MLKRTQNVLAAITFCLMAMFFIKIPFASNAWAVPPERPLHATCVVTTTADSGSGSLRECLQNAGVGDTISFDTGAFPLGSPATIAITSGQLPSITVNNLTIDGTTAGVILDGSGAPAGTSGLVIDGADNVTIKGLQILIFPGNGVEVRNGASYNTVGGTNGLPGGTCTGDCNLISGSGSNGVSIRGTGTISNTISGNYIGTNISGTAIISNNIGVDIGGGASFNTISNNLISGNEFLGISIIDNGSNYNRVQGNYIGTNASGVGILGNGDNGISINVGPQYTLIGGINGMPGGLCNGECNLISGNKGSGIEIESSGTSNNVVSGNYIGTDVNGTTAISNANIGIWVGDGAQSNLIGGDTPGERNLISGNGINGVTIDGSDTMSNTVSGNYIGTDVSGTTAIPNGDPGVRIDGGASYNLIGGINAMPGGECSGDCNLISGNGDDVWEVGVWIEGSGTVSNTVSGNYIGTDVNGTAALGNASDGVRLHDGPEYNVIGGTTPAERNLISGNGRDGVELAGVHHNLISGNYIGTDASGLIALGNTERGMGMNEGGIGLSTTQNNIKGNLISGNGTNGMDIYGADTISNTITGNYIGTDPNGLNGLGNGDNGILFGGGAHNNTIGGATAQDRNLISGNGGNGIVIFDTGTMSNTIIGNYIGADVSGTMVISNQGDGIDITNGAQYNRIGGNIPDERNLISGNDGNGVHFGLDASYNTVSGNYIGTDASGTFAVPNVANGVNFDTGNYNIIGGSNSTPDGPCSGECNLISGNGEDGIEIELAARGNAINGNFIGSDVSGTFPLGNAENGVHIIEGSTENLIGGNIPDERNLISGNDGDGVSIRDSGTMSNTIIGNYIGTDVSGTVVISNALNGVRIDGGAQQNVVGGNTSGERNLISGNGDGIGNAGVWIYGSGTMSNTVSGNHIGTDVNGTSALGNNWDGVWVGGDAVNNIIGGPTTGERNLISGNARVGVSINGEGSSVAGNVMQGNYIGTDVTGTSALGNGVNDDYTAVEIYYSFNNTIVDNLISGNNGAGIVIQGDSSTGNELQGNYIGTDLSGTMAISNTSSGVWISNGAQNNLIGGNNATPGGICSDDCNLISGNGRDGVFIHDAGTMSNTISGNYIGTDVNGTSDLGNTQEGVDITDSSHNLIGGATSGERNIISGNNGDGVMIRLSQALSNTVSGNYIGTDVSGTVVISNNDQAVSLREGVSYNVIGGVTPGERNIINGSNTAGVFLESAGTMSNTVSGNYIGTDASGTVGLGNYNGIVIGDPVDNGPQYNLIGGINTAVGGACTGSCNLISGNRGAGVLLVYNQTNNNTIRGNYIGTDVSGTDVISNSNAGVYIGSGAKYNFIGGSNASPGGNCSGECNLISGNGYDGVAIRNSGTMSNTVSGNYIGTDVSGTMGLGNGEDDDGVGLRNGPAHNIIGGNTPGQRNLISGNGDNGVKLDGIDTVHNLVIGNYIGTDVSGTAAISNTEDGVAFQDGTSLNRVGGNDSGERNLISGNGEAGVNIRDGSTNNVVIGNYIGTDASGTADLPNSNDGVLINGDSSQNTIGISNTIAYNGESGVQVDGVNSLNNTITRNSIYSNTVQGIELSNGGNADLSPPLITGYHLVSGTVSGTACPLCTVEVYSDMADEGRWLEAITITTVSGLWSVDTGAPLTGPQVTATATDAGGNTSEFGTFCESVTEIPQAECEALLTFYNSTGGPTEWSIRTGWLTSTTTCSWYGVTCEAEHVTQLDLISNTLTGTIPISLTNLSNLQVLLLGDNQLTGEIPYQLGDLINLEALYLSRNDLTGQIPPELGNLTNLQALALRTNQLTGTIPISLSNLTNLKWLWLAENQLNGSIPPELGNLANLLTLSVRSNQLTGTIPISLSNLSNLEVLYLTDNQLTGTIPISLSNLSNLQQLLLHFNHLDGTIPSELGSLTNLHTLYLSSNRLSGEIPPELGDLSNLTILHLENNALEGEIPFTITNLTALTDLDLGYNKLFATDPAVTIFLNSKDPDWADTQTIAPTDVYVSGGSVGQTAADIQLTWKPISYTAHGGYYEISYANTSGGPYMVHGTTSNKAASSYLVNNLPVNAPYYFVIKTFTPVHDNQQNNLWSDYSQEILETVNGVGSAMISPEGGELLATVGKNDITLIFPPDTVSEPTVVSIQPAISPPASAGLTFLGQAFAIEARTSEGVPVSTFSLPFTMTVVYDEASLAGGMDEASLKLYDWDEGANKWAELPSTLDTAASTLTANLDHLTIFAVLGRSNNTETQIYLPILLRND